MFGRLSTFSVQVGTLQLELSIDHPVRAQAEVHAHWARLDEALGAKESRFFGAAYRAVELSLHDIELDARAGRACARFDLVQPRADFPLRGMGAAFAPFISPIHGVVVIGQLAQALLYRLDGVDRSNSQNLWMRKVLIESPRPCRAERGHRAETWSSRLSLLRSKGTIWRTGTFKVAMAGLAGEYSVAHQLPEGARIAAETRQDVRSRDAECAPSEDRSVVR